MGGGASSEQPPRVSSAPAARPVQQQQQIQQQQQPRPQRPQQQHTQLVPPAAVLPSVYPHAGAPNQNGMGWQQATLPAQGTAGRPAYPVVSSSWPTIDAWSAHGGQANPAPSRPTPQPQPRLPAPTGRNPASASDAEVMACCKFRLRDLSEATNCFSSANVIGEGGFGKVYRGTLVDGTQVAVKRLDPLSLQGDREYYAEISLLTRLRHPNLVCIMGMCVEDGHKLGVFEFMQRGSLRDLLDRKELSWRDRMGVAVGASRGLAYLHDMTVPPVIHCDFKSPNVLIDVHGQAHVADFGLARHIGGARPQVSGSAPSASQLPDVTTVTSIRGTFGYLSPEYLEQGQASVRADVFAFGVVLLELMTGLQVVDATRGRGLEGLADWARPFLQQPEHFTAALMDAAIAHEAPAVHVAVLCEVAEACLRTNPRERPAMLDVVRTLSAASSFSEAPRTPPRPPRSPTPPPAEPPRPSSSAAPYPFQPLSPAERASTMGGPGAEASSGGRAGARASSAPAREERTSEPQQQQDSPVAGTASGGNNASNLRAGKPLLQQLQAGGGAAAAAGWNASPPSPMGTLPPLPPAGRRFPYQGPAAAVGSPRSVEEPSWLRASQHQRHLMPIESIRGTGGESFNCFDAPLPVPGAVRSARASASGPDEGGTGGVSVALEALALGGQRTPRSPPSGAAASPTALPGFSGSCAAGAAPPEEPRFVGEWPSAGSPARCASPSGSGGGPWESAAAAAAPHHRLRDASPGAGRSSAPQSAVPAVGGGLGRTAPLVLPSVSMFGH